jgi:D-alanyl-lipoteichoic acid acyltransferase DltB (MBOAT superfamily)
MPAWLVMWMLAGGLFAASKLATWWPARERVALGYLVAWPGMDPRVFTPGRRHAEPIEWIGGTVRLALGVVLLFAMARLAPNPLLQAWVGGIGIVLILHFGVFHLLALGWGVRPIMRAPMRATSLSDFWGRRWNLAFHELAVQLIYNRVRGRIGLAPAVLLTFLASGVVHDLVISVPARGGYGLPTLYFLLQGAGVIVERRFRLSSAWAGRVRVVLVAWLPVVILFHPWFMLGVVAPFMRAIGAL